MRFMSTKSNYNDDKELSKKNAVTTIEEFYLKFIKNTHRNNIIKFNIKKDTEYIIKKF